MTTYPEINRIYVNNPNVDKITGYTSSEKILAPCPPGQANLITSIVPDANPATESLHAPVIDMDFPIEVYPSSQLGHHHLYINKLITFDQYKKLLTTLSDIGLCEPGFVAAAIKKGYSSVRPPGVAKPGVQPSAVKVLQENAKLRQENYKLKQLLKNNEK